MGVKMRGILVVFRFECLDETTNDLALVGRIELDDADVTKRGLAGFLLEAERQPNRSELDGLSAATFGYPGLRKRLRNLQSLAFKCVGRNDVDLAEAGNARCNRSKDF